MKKTVAGILAAGALALTVVLGGCAGQQQAAPAPAEPVAQEQAAEATAQEQTTQEQAAEPTAPAATSAPAPSAQQPQYIGEDEAKRIAFGDAGVAEQDTSYLRAELDTDDGVTKYEVDFHVGQMEHEYDIDPVTGAILGHSAEIDDD